MTDWKVGDKARVLRDMEWSCAPNGIYRKGEIHIVNYVDTLGNPIFKGDASRVGWCNSKKWFEKVAEERPFFKSGDWVTVEGDDYFTPGKKYEVFSDEDGDLYLTDDEGDLRCAPLDGYHKYFQVQKTTAPDPETPPEEIQAHGRTYTLKPLPPHEFKFGDWARHSLYGVVFVVCGLKNNDYYVYSVEGHHLCLPKSELTYISTAEIPS